MCCPTDFTASVTTAFSPMPTEPTTLHWPAGSSVYPTRRRPARTATAPKIFTKAASGTLVLAAAGEWSSSRPSNPAASLGCGPARQSGSTAHDHHTALAIPLSPLPSDAAISSATATLRRQRPPAPPSAGKTRSIEYQITAPIASAVAKTGTAPLAQPSPYPEPSNQIKQRRQIPHRPTPASARTPRGFLPRGFSDACLRAAPPPGDWQASENP